MKILNFIALIPCLMFTGCAGNRQTSQSHTQSPSAAPSRTQKPSPKPTQKTLSSPTPTTNVPVDLSKNDIIYNSDPELKMDSYIPLTGDNFIPIVLVHGGGFENGDKAQDLYVKMTKAFAENGYAAFSINYTLVKLNETMAVNARQIASDNVLSAINYIKVHSTELKINKDKIVILGDSAGGAIVTNIAFAQGKQAGIAACIDLWGGMPVNSRDGTPWGGDVYPKPIDKSKAVPFLIMHGTSDTVAGYNVSVRLSNKLNENQIKNELIPLESAGHYPEELGDTIIENILKFLNKELV